MAKAEAVFKRLFLPRTLEESQAYTSLHSSSVMFFLVFRQEMNLSTLRGKVKCAREITQEAKPYENVRGFLLTGSLVGTQACLSFQMCGLTQSPWANSPNPYLPASYPQPTQALLSKRQTYPCSYSYDWPHGSSNEQASGRKNFQNCLCKQRHPAWMQFYPSSNPINPDNPIYDCFHKYLKGVKLKQPLQYEELFLRCSF